jgi:hypothetical protein
MALAILDLLGIDDGNARFRIDTGTNRYYQLKLGRGVGTRSGFDWIDGVVHTTPIQLNEAGGGLLDSSTELSVPLGRARRHERGPTYAQLFSFKTREGRSPAFSAVLSLDHAMSVPGPDYELPESSAMHDLMAIGPPSFQRPRTVACRTCAEQFGAPGIGDLLTQLLKVAAPVVLDFLQKGQPPAVTPPVVTGGTPAGAKPPAPPAGVQPNLLADIVGGIFKAIAGGSIPLLSKGQTLLDGPASRPNRFLLNGHAQLSQPFVFGIDDVIIGQLIGKFVEILPALANATNQKRIAMQANQNKLVSDLVGDVERRMLLEKVLEAQRSAPVDQTGDLGKLADLLQQMPAAGNAQPAAAAKSLSWEDGHHARLSNRAVVAFDTAPALRWNGADHVVFAKGQPIALKLKLTVGEPVPSQPLPKAIVRVWVKDCSDQTVFAEKVSKHKDLTAGGIITVPFTAAEVAGVPAGKPVSLLAEIHWRGSSGREHKALGSLESVFVNRHFVTERGAAVGPEVELTDMNRYRAFYNKLWESPALDAAAPNQRKLLWKLDANLKYSVLIAPEHASNGSMETRFLVAPDDRDTVADRTAGRMKGGIELSIDELSKLAPLWDGEAALDPERLDAFRTADFAKASSGELVDHVKLDGRHGERGLVWVVPVLQMVNYTLGTVQTTDDSGQVIAIAAEPARMPMAVAARILGLKTAADEEGDGDSESTADGEPLYRFEGFKVELSRKVALTPAAVATMPPEGRWLHG